MQKIAIDCRELQGRMTGIGRFLSNFLEYAARFDKENEYLLLFNKNTALPVKADNILHRVIPETSTFFWDQVQLPLALNQERADLLFSPYYKCPALLSFPSIITIHDVHFFTLPLYHRKNGFFLNSYYRTAGRIFCKKALSILTVSSNSKKDIVKVYGAPSEKIQVVYNAVDPGRYHPMDPDRARREIQSHFPQIRGAYLLYVGNSKPHKNIPFLVQSYASLPRSLRNTYQLVLIGVNEDVRNAATSLGLDRETVVLPCVAENMLTPMYNAASLFVTASLYEGFCFPAVESMACGVPVLVSDRGSLPEVVGNAGIFFDPSRVSDLTGKMEMILEDSSLRESLSRRCLERAHLYSPEKFSQRILDVISRSRLEEHSIHRPPR